MFDALRGITVGNEGLVYTTGDGGLTWTRRLNGSGETVHKIVAIDAQRAWAAMEDGEIMKTIDGGRFWSSQRVYVGSSQADATIAGIAFPNVQNGWACIRGRIGTAGIPSILKTTNSGDDWEDVNNAPAHNGFALDTFDGQTIVSVGFDGAGAPIVRSTNGGQSWTYTRYPGSSIIRDVDMVSPNVGFMAAGSRIIKSTDGFATWTTIQDGGNWFDVSFVDANNGWALGASPTNSLTELWHTSNGGQSWDIKSIPDATAVHAVNAQTVWVLEHNYDPDPLGNPTHSQRSIDGGQTFIRELVSLENVSTALFFVDADNGWSGGVSRLTPSLTNDGAEIFRRGTLGLNTPARTPFDFDGDGRADLSVFRPSDRIWYLNQSTAGFAAMQFGLSDDNLAAADYDGDGRADIAVYRASEGVWYIANSSNGTYSTARFGIAEDIATPGDFDGDGRADFAVFRPSSGTWYYLQSSNGQPRGIQFGQSGDIPVTGDFDGDGKADVAVFRPANGYWYWIASADNQPQLANFGQNGDIPLNGDFNGDGKSDLAVFRPSDGIWYVARPRGVPAQNFDATHFGISTDTPVPADYDGDGKTDIAVYRGGVWFIQRSTAGFTAQNFGLADDIPVSYANLP